MTPTNRTAPPQYRTVKVPMWVYQNAVAARAELMRRGLNAIPSDLSFKLLEPFPCPRCGQPTETTAIAFAHVHCQGCGYTQTSVAATAPDIGSLGLGVLLGLGIAALIGSLDE